MGIVSSIPYLGSSSKQEANTQRGNYEDFDPPLLPPFPPPFPPVATNSTATGFLNVDKPVILAPVDKPSTLIIPGNLNQPLLVSYPAVPNGQQPSPVQTMPYPFVLPPPQFIYPPPPFEPKFPAPSSNTITKEVSSDTFCARKRKKEKSRRSKKGQHRRRRHHEESDDVDGCCVCWSQADKRRKGGWKLWTKTRDHRCRHHNHPHHRKFPRYDDSSLASKTDECASILEKPPPRCICKTPLRHCITDEEKEKPLEYVTAMQPPQHSSLHRHINKQPPCADCPRCVHLRSNSPCVRRKERHLRHKAPVSNVECIPTQSQMPCCCCCSRTPCIPACGSIKHRRLSSLQDTSIDVCTENDITQVNATMIHNVQISLRSTNKNNQKVRKYNFSLDTIKILCSLLSGAKNSANESSLNHRNFRNVACSPVKDFLCSNNFSSRASQRILTAASCRGESSSLFRENNSFTFLKDSFHGRHIKKLLRSFDEDLCHLPFRCTCNPDKMKSRENCLESDEAVKICCPCWTHCLDDDILKGTEFRCNPSPGHCQHVHYFTCCCEAEKTRESCSDANRKQKPVKSVCMCYRDVINKNRRKIKNARVNTELSGEICLDHCNCQSQPKCCCCICSRYCCTVRRNTHSPVPIIAPPSSSPRRDGPQQKRTVSCQNLMPLYNCSSSSETCDSTVAEVEDIEDDSKPAVQSNVTQNSSMIAVSNHDDANIHCPSVHKGNICKASSRQSNCRDGNFVPVNKHLTSDTTCPNTVTREQQTRKKSCSENSCSYDKAYEGNGRCKQSEQQCSAKRTFVRLSDGRICCHGNRCSKRYPNDRCDRKDFSSPRSKRMRTSNDSGCKQEHVCKQKVTENQNICEISTSDSSCKKGCRTYRASSRKDCSFRKCRPCEDHSKEKERPGRKCESCRLSEVEKCRAEETECGKEAEYRYIDAESSGPHDECRDCPCFYRPKKEGTFTRETTTPNGFESCEVIETEITRSRTRILSNNDNLQGNLNDINKNKEKPHTKVKGSEAREPRRKWSKPVVGSGSFMYKFKEADSTGSGKSHSRCGTKCGSIRYNKDVLQRRHKSWDSSHVDYKCQENDDGQNCSSRSHCKCEQPVSSSYSSPCHVECSNSIERRCYRNQFSPCEQCQSCHTPNGSSVSGRCCSIAHQNNINEQQSSENPRTRLEGPQSACCTNTGNSCCQKCCDLRHPCPHPDQRGLNVSLSIQEDCPAVEKCLSQVTVSLKCEGCNDQGSRTSCTRMLEQSSDHKFGAEHRASPCQKCTEKSVSAAQSAQCVQIEPHKKCKQCEIKKTWTQEGGAHDKGDSHESRDCHDGRQSAYNCRNSERSCHGQECKKRCSTCSQCHSSSCLGAKSGVKGSRDPRSCSQAENVTKRSFLTKIRQWPRSRSNTAHCQHTDEAYTNVHHCATDTHFIANPGNESSCKSSRNSQKQCKRNTLKHFMPYGIPCQCLKKKRRSSSACRKQPSSNRRQSTSVQMDSSCRTEAQEHPCFCCSDLRSVYLPNSSSSRERQKQCRKSCPAREYQRCPIKPDLSETTRTSCTTTPQSRNRKNPHHSSNLPTCLPTYSDNRINSCTSTNSKSGGEKGRSRISDEFKCKSDERLCPRNNHSACKCYSKSPVSTQSFSSLSRTCQTKDQSSVGISSIRLCKNYAVDLNKCQWLCQHSVDCSESKSESSNNAGIFSEDASICKSKSGDIEPCKTCCLSINSSYSSKEKSHVVSGASIKYLNKSRSSNNCPVTCTRLGKHVRSDCQNKPKFRSRPSFSLFHSIFRIPHAHIRTDKSLQVDLQTECLTVLSKRHIKISKTPKL